MRRKYIVQRKKRLFVVFPSLLVFILLMGFRSTGYILDGDITAPDGTRIIISYRYQGKDIVDSSVMKNNRFSLIGVLPESVVCTLSNSLNHQMRIFIMENRPVNLNGAIDKFHSLKINGAIQNELFEGFRSKSLQLSGQYRSAVKQTAGNLKDMQSKEYLHYRKAVDSLTLDFVKANPTATASALAIVDSYLYTSERKAAARSYSFLSEQLQRSFYARRVKQFLETEETIRPGRTAPGFALAKLNGQSLKLSDYKGKYVLLDFWASWCPPCRAEHPLMKKLHEIFGVKDIEFISVSMDAVNSAWKQAVKVDELTWTQVNDSQALNGEVADSYGIKSLPFNCIVDPDGKILATKLRGKALEDFLYILFKKTKQE